MDEIKQYGFLPPAIDLQNDYVLGGFRAAPEDILEPTGQWDKFLPALEVQHNQVFDSSNCTAYGTLNALELLMLRKFKKSINFAERYTGICAGTYPPGNDPQTVIESIRKEAGLIEEFYLPFTSLDMTMKLDEYYSPKPMIEQLLNKGKRFLEEYLIKHEWVFLPGENDKPSKLKEALKSSPLGVSVRAWVKEGDYYVKKEGEQDTHWTIIFGYEDGKYWKVYDSYESGVKKLAWNYAFGFAKRYYIEKITTSQKKTFLARLKEWFSLYFREVFQ